jgi:hypothetical protein
MRLPGTSFLLKTPVAAVKFVGSTLGAGEIQVKGDLMKAAGEWGRKMVCPSSSRI